MDGFQTTISGMLGFGEEIDDALFNARSVNSVPTEPKTTADQENPVNTITDEDLVSDGNSWYQRLRTVSDLPLDSEHRPDDQRGQKQSRTGSQYNELVG